MDELTETIQVSKDTKESLDQFSSGQTHDQLIRNLLRFWMKTIDKMQEETNMENMRDSVKKEDFTKVPKSKVN